MSASVKQQIEALSSVDPADAARINSAITHSEFSKAKKEELALAVLRQVSKAVDDEDPSKDQVLMHPYNYATHTAIWSISRTCRRATNNVPCDCALA